MTDGRVFTHQVDYPKGEPENPLSDNEVEEKFISLAMSSGLTMERCNDILHTIKQPSFKLKTLLEKLN